MTPQRILSAQKRHASTIGIMADIGMSMMEAFGDIRKEHVSAMPDDCNDLIEAKEREVNWEERQDAADIKAEQRNDNNCEPPDDFISLDDPQTPSEIKAVIDAKNRLYYANHQHDAAMCDCGAGVRVNSAGAVVCSSPARHA